MRMTKSLHSWTTSQSNPVMSWWCPGIMRCSWDQLDENLSLEVYRVAHRMTRATAPIRSALRGREPVSCRR